VECVRQRGKTRRYKNAGDNRNAGERRKRTQHQRRAPNAAPAFTGGIQKYWRSGCSRWSDNVCERLLCPKPRKVSITSTEDCGHMRNQDRGPTASTIDN
jgi:hypothetical protein